MSHVVLVHGAWSDGSVWQDVIRALQDRGHDALALQLPMISLIDDIEWTRRHLTMLDPPVTLVGHSYGGMVTAAAATRDSPVRSLVFVAAYAPDQSESVVTLSGQVRQCPAGTPSASARTAGPPSTPPGSTTRWPAICP